jgi:hypothetical protein
MVSVRIGLQRALVWLGLREAPYVPTDRQRAVDLIAAIDAGGMPLNPARVNDIGRKLGLEVSPNAPMPQTIARIRAVLESTAP